MVTGGSRGIGKQVALNLAREGAHVAICARNGDFLQPTVEAIEKCGSKALACTCDVSKKADLDRFCDQVLSAWGQVDILVNNAGGGGPAYKGDFEKAGEEVWRETLDLNTFSTIRLINRLVPQMRERGWGRVVALSSKQGREGGGRPWYNMSKAALISLMKTYAMNFELARSGVTFNTVAPGAILTEIGNWADFKKEDPEKFETRLKTTFPMGRLGTAEEVAAVISFLCSEPARFVNGVCVSVDGAESKVF